MNPIFWAAVFGVATAQAVIYWRHHRRQAVGSYQLLKSDEGEVVFKIRGVMGAFMTFKLSPALAYKMSDELMRSAAGIAPRHFRSFEEEKRAFEEGRPR